MNTAKAFLVGIVLTVGLLASSFAFEGLGQLLGPEEEDHTEEEDHAEEVLEDAE